MKHALRLSVVWVVLALQLFTNYDAEAQTNYYYWLNQGFSDICANSPASTQVGNSSSTPSYAALPRTLDNLTFNAITRGSGVNCNIGGSAASNGGFIVTAFGIGPGRTVADAFNDREYIEFSITTDACYSATISQIVLRVFCSATGPYRFWFGYRIGSVSDNPADWTALKDSTMSGSYGSVGASTVTSALNSLAINVPANTTIYFRLYGYQASGATGTLRLVGADNEATQRTYIRIATTAEHPSTPVAPLSTTPGCTDVQISYGAATLAGLPPNVRYYWQSTSAAGTSTASPFTSPAALSRTVTSDGTYYIRARNDLTGCWSTASTATTANVLADGGTPGLWTGAASSDWNDCQNWDNGTVPGFLGNVTISGTPANLPSNIPNMTILNSLTLNESTAGDAALAAGAVVTVNSLTLTNGKLNLNSGNLSVANEAPTAIAGGNTNAYLYNGTLNRGVWNATPGTEYDFPVGDATRLRRLRYTQTNVRNVLDLVSVQWNTGAFGSPTFNPGLHGFTDSTATFEHAFNEGSWHITSNFGDDAYDLEVFPNWASASWCGGACQAYTLLKASGGVFSNGSSVSVAADGGPYDTNPAPNSSNGLSAAGGIKRSGFTSFSDIIVVGASNSPFPVELLAFSAQWSGNDARLAWTTAQERNNLGFFVERSVNGHTFEELGFVEGANTTSTPRHYTFTDAAPVGNSLFYRLRQVDLDGTTTYTHTVELSRNAAALPLMRVYPNPTNATVQIDLQGISETAEVSGELVALDGRALFRSAGTPATVCAALGQHIGTLPAGVYSLQLNAGGTLLRRAIIKQ